jgi:6-phosphogluconolactonase
MRLAFTTSRLARYLLGLVGTGVLLTVAAVPAMAGENRPGAVYTQTQDPAGNQIVVYERAFDGTITETARVATGGVGVASTPPFGFPILDSQGGVELTRNGRLLFAVNAGDDTVSSFSVGPHGLSLVDREASGGDLPVSVDSSGGLLYVLNELSGAISGLRFDSGGQMTPVPGSTESLSTPGAAGVAAQVGFSPSGGLLAVTQRATNVIDTFRLGADDTPGPAQPNPATGLTPFGFAFQDNDILIGSNVGQVGDPADPANFQGSASSYGVTAGGDLTPIDRLDVGQLATCWVVITADDKFAFMTNTASQSVSSFRLGHDGSLTLLGHTPTGPGAPADEALSVDSRYLYVLVPSLGPGTTSHIDAYRVNENGSLTHIDTTPSNLPPGASGLAAH